MQNDKRHYRVILADALQAHEDALHVGSGLAGISNLSNIQGALGRPYHGYHPRLDQKAAALLHGMATSHGFSDANKRTAWVVTTLLISQSGFLLSLIESDRIDDVVVDTVEGKMTEEQLVQWFKERLIRIE